MASAYGRLSQKTIRTQKQQHYDKKVGRDDFWNDPTNRMHGFQDFEDLMESLRDDNEKMGQEARDFLQAQYKSVRRRKQDRSKPPNIYDMVEHRRKVKKLPDKFYEEKEL